MRHLLLVLMVFLPTLAGCDIGRWELKEDKQGRVVRLDRWFGSMAVLEGSRLVPVKDIQATAAVAEARLWPEIDMPNLGGRKATLRTAWRRETMYYRVELRPAPDEALSRRLLQLTVTLNDDGGFDLMSIPIPLSSMTQIVDDKGKEVSRVMNSSVVLDYEEYVRAAHWKMGWKSLP